MCQKASEKVPPPKKMEISQYPGIPKTTIWFFFP